MTKIKKSLAFSVMIHSFPLMFLIPSFFNSDKKNEEFTDISVNYEDSDDSSEEKKIETPDFNLSKGSENYADSEARSFVKGTEIISSNELSGGDSPFYFGIGVEFDQDPIFATVDNQRLMGFNIIKVYSEYSAEVSGIKEKDVILKVNGINMNSKFSFKENEVVKLLVLRNNKVLTLSVKVEKIPFKI